ncbi:hypothetical protein KM043_016869 [Ampulex compressa]|nr:hypothetical protein KM043_016869 [Ampulex compressa]
MSERGEGCEKRRARGTEIMLRECRVGESLRTKHLPRKPPSTYGPRTSYGVRPHTSTSRIDSAAILASPMDTLVRRMKRKHGMRMVVRYERMEDGYSLGRIVYINGINIFGGCYLSSKTNGGRLRLQAPC